MNCCHWIIGASSCSEDTIGLMKKCKINNNNNDNKNNVECNKNHNHTDVSCLPGFLEIQDENRSIYDFYSSSSNKRGKHCCNNRNSQQTIVGL